MRGAAYMGFMSDINPAAKAAMAAARRGNGEFGFQTHTDPEAELGGAYVTGQPVYGTMTFEAYDSPDDEDPTTAAVQKVDVASILDTFPLDEVQRLVSDPYAYSDDIGYELQKQGALTHPSHPFVFTPDVDDLDAYFDYRTREGLTAPVSENATPSAENLAAVVEHTRSAIDTMRAELARLEEEKEAAEENVVRAVMAEAGVNADVVGLRLDDAEVPITAYANGHKPVPVDSDAVVRAVAELRRLLGEDPGVVGGLGTSRVVILRGPGA